MRSPRLPTMADQAVFWAALDTLFAAGVPLERSFRVMARQFAAGPLGEICDKVSEGLRQGRSLPLALAARGVFPPFTLAVLEAGCRTGALSRLLGDLAVHEQRRHQRESRVRAALYYPLFTLVVALVFLVVVPPMLLGGLFDLLERTGTPLGWGTRLVAALAALARQPWFYVAVAAVVTLSWGRWRRLLRNPAHQLRLERLIQRVPVLRSTWSALVLSRFAGSLAVALDTGLPLDKALELAAKASGSRLLRVQAKDVVQAVIDGQELSRALRQAVPRMFAQTVRVGEEAGSLPRLLGSLATLYEREFEYRAEQLTILLEPLFLGAVGLIVAGLAVTAIGPLAEVVAGL